MAKNHALAQALSRAGKELTKAKAQLSQMAQPPKTFATMVKVDSSMTDELGVQHASAEILTGGRRLVVPVAANVNASRLTAGACVLLNENMVLVEQRGTDMLGSVRTIRQVLDDGRLIVADGGGNPSVIRRSGALAHKTFANGQRVIVDPSGRLALELLPDENDADLVLEEVPDVTFADIGGLDSQIERIRDAVQLPFLHRGLYERYNLKAPKGVLLYGPPGNGKTMIAKAVAHALSDGFGRGSGVFLSVKVRNCSTSSSVNPSVWCVRSSPARANAPRTAGRSSCSSMRWIRCCAPVAPASPATWRHDRAAVPLRTRRRGEPRQRYGDRRLEPRGHDRPRRAPPGTTGREDPRGPPRGGSGGIHHSPLSDRRPAPAARTGRDGLSRVLVRDIYTRSSRRHLCDACNDQGQWSAIFLSDVASGAMLKNIVDRAKTKAVKASILGGDDVALNVELLGEAVEDEFVETRGSVMDVDPVQWSRINGMDNGRVVRIRPVPRKEKENMQ